MHIVVRLPGMGDVPSRSWTLEGVASGAWQGNWLRSMSWRNGNTQRLK